jgi:toxin secretion/phage lysis holin
MKEREIFNSTIAVLGTFFTYFFGGWDTVLLVLVAFIVLDYCTGVLGAFIQKEVSSSIGARGILKKATILIVLIVAVLLDKLIGNEGQVFRTAVCYFYICNEGISLLENIAKIGVPVPRKLLDVLVQIKDKGEQI